MKRRGKKREKTKQITPGVWEVTEPYHPLSGVMSRPGIAKGELAIPLISTKPPSKAGDVWLAVNDEIAECKSDVNVWAFGRTEQEAILNLGIAVAKKSFKASLKSQFRDWL